MPQVLHRRVIVQRDTVDQVLPADLRIIAITDIGVVETEIVVGARVGRLYERPDMGRDLSSQEKAQLLRKLDVHLGWFVSTWGNVSVRVTDV